MKCPKCGYESKASEDVQDWQCPSCKPAPAFELVPMEPRVELEPKIELEPKTQLALQPEMKARQKPNRKSVLGAIADTNGADTYEADQDEDNIDEEQDERHWLAAAGQKIVIYSIIINFFLRTAEKSIAPPEIMMSALFFCTAVYSLIGVVKICSGLDKSQNQKILYMVLSFFPLINILMLVYLSVKTSRMLRDAGWTVGLFGAKP
jgi:hypothetical protein